LKASASVVAASSVPYFFSQIRSMADEIASKNDRTPIGLIGARGMGMGNMDSARQWLDIVAIAKSRSR